MFAVKKQWALHILSVCVCSLSYPACTVHGPYYIVICGLSGSYHIFFYILINSVIFRNKLLNIKYVFWFSLQLLSETFLILRRIKWDTIINVRRSSCKAPLIVRFWWNLNFLYDFQKIFKHQISFKSIWWEPSSSVRSDRWTDLTKLTVTFHNFANMPEKDATFISFFISYSAAECSVSFTELLRLLLAIMESKGWSLI